MARRYGVRFSLTDLAVLAAGGILWWAAASRDVAWMVAVVVGHFFLFCNVFRVRRSFELIWAGILVVNFAAWGLATPDHETFPWPFLLLAQAPFTLLAIGIEMKSAAYHGIGARRINPRLDEYLDEDA